MTSISEPTPNADGASDGPSTERPPEAGLRLVLAWAAKITGGVLVAAALIGLAAVLARPVHDAILWLGWSRAKDPLELAEAFLKVFRRLAMLFILGAALAFFRPWRFARQSNNNFGLNRPRGIRAGLMGFAVVFTVGVLLLLWQLSEGWIKWEDPLDWGKIAKRWGRVLIAPAIVVAIMEEWLFRGWMQHRAEQRMRPVFGAILVSAGYAFIHAFRPGGEVAEITLDAAGALHAAQAWLMYAVDPVRFGFAFVGLFLLGMLLTAVYRRTQTLWAPIGVHAGGIWLIYSYGTFTDRHPARSWAGGKLLYDGPAGWIVLFVAAVLIWPRRRTKVAG